MWQRRASKKIVTEEWRNTEAADEELREHWNENVEEEKNMVFKVKENEREKRDMERERGKNKTKVD